MIVEWIIVAIFVFMGLLYIKLEHGMSKVKILVIVIVGFVVYFSIVNHFTSDQVDLTSPKGIVNGVYLYVGWVGSTATNLWNIGANTVSMVGNAIKIDKVEEDKK